MTPAIFRSFGVLLLVCTAWSCRRGVERNLPPLATPQGGARFITVSAGDSPSSSHGAGDTESPSSRADPSDADKRSPSLGVERGAHPADAIPSGMADSKPRLRLALEEFTWTFDDPTYGRLDVVVVLPDRHPDEKFPMLIALHGRGEAMKGSVRGARGWVDDYALMRAMRRLSSPPLTVTDFEGVVAPRRLEKLNFGLQAEPYRGLVVLCPYTTELLAGDKPFERARPYAKFLVDTLLPRARRELPVIGTAEATGIDGVSLGGRIGILSGLYAPERFHTIAGLQAAFDVDDAVALGRLGDEALRRNRGLRFRLLTSDRDYFLEANAAIATEFRHRALPVQFLVVTGPHDYVFNRGSGSIEMLVFHDRALRGRPDLD
jgi:iron(III)-salmochelin esterase